LAHRFIVGRGCGVRYRFLVGRRLEAQGGTHMKESLPVLDAIESWAKSEGCTRLQGDGRKGWVKALQNIGWRPVSVQVEKGIS
jgi:hypothetical protein